MTHEGFVVRRNDSGAYYLLARWRFPMSFRVTSYGSMTSPSSSRPYLADRT